MPATFQALLIFFFFSIPAYLAVTSYKVRNPVRYYREKQSIIEQATLYIFLGTVVNILIISYFWLLGWLVIIIRNLLFARAISIPYVLGNSVGGLFVATFLLIIAYFVSGAIFSFLINKVNILEYFLQSEDPLWIKELNQLKAIQTTPEARIPWILVHLKNGDRCLGFVSEFRWIGDQDNKMELTLEKAFYQLANKADKEDVGRILLRSDDILWLSPYSE